MKRILLVLACLAPLPLLNGCEESAAAAPRWDGADGRSPIVTSELIGVTLFSLPVSDDSPKSAREPTPNARVAVFDDFILVTEPDGTTELSLHGWYSNLRFRADER